MVDAVVGLVAAVDLVVERHGAVGGDGQAKEKLLEVG
jgi:hypothetical protein